jgi:hypothetical protein
MHHAWRTDRAPVAFCPGRRQNLKEIQQDVQHLTAEAAV